MFRRHSGLCHHRWLSAQCVHFSLNLRLLRTPTPLLAIQPDVIINTTFFDLCRLSVRRWVIVNTQGNCRHNRCADDRLMYSPYNGDVHSPACKLPACNLPRRQCLCGSAYTMKLQAIWLTSVFQSRLHKVVNSCVPRRLEFLRSRVLGPLQASAASLSMDREHGTVYLQPCVHRTSRCAHSSAS